MTSSRVRTHSVFINDLTPVYGRYLSLLHADLERHEAPPERIYLVRHKSFCPPMCVLLENPPPQPRLFWSLPRASSDTGPEPLTRLCMISEAEWTELTLPLRAEAFWEAARRSDRGLDGETWFVRHKQRELDRSFDVWNPRASGPVANVHAFGQALMRRIGREMPRRCEQGHAVAADAGCCTECGGRVRDAADFYPPS